MRWTTFRQHGHATERVGVLQHDHVHALPDGATLLGLLGDDGERLQRAGEQALRDPRGVHALADIELLAPIPQPPSMRDFMAFEAHFKNVQDALGRAVPSEYYDAPAFYFSNPAAIVGPHADIAIAPGTRCWDYELEVAAIIGRGGRDLNPQRAQEHIVGYSVLCDFSARDLQSREMTVGLGPTKAKDSATSIGPWLVTADELAPYAAERGFSLAMRAQVNGRPYSEGRLDSLDWSFGELLAYASRGTELRPGDILGTGTVGTGCILELMLMRGPGEYPWLVVDDVVELEVEQLGRLRHRIVPGADVVELAPRARR